MFQAAIRALYDVLSPQLRSILFKSIGLTLLIFAALLVATNYALSYMTLLPWSWADTAAHYGAGLLMLVALVFLISPVAALLIGLFLDKVAAQVEQTHYPFDPPGQPLSLVTSLLASGGFALVTLCVMLAVLPLVFTGIGALALVAANAYLLSREYFVMAAARHMPLAEARLLRKNLSPTIFAAGFIPALLSLVPIINLAVPLFATAFFVHLFKKVQRSSV